MENVYVIYSHYSNHCKYIIQSLPVLQNNDIKTICIDHKSFRDRLLKDNLYKLTQVPSIIINYNNKSTIYQGQDATNFVKDKIKSINNKDVSEKKFKSKYDEISSKLIEQKKNNKKIIDQSRNFQNDITNLKKTLEFYKTKIQKLEQYSQPPKPQPPKPQPPNHEQYYQATPNELQRTSIDDILYDDEEEESEQGSGMGNEDDSVVEKAIKMQELRKY